MLKSTTFFGLLTLLLPNLLLGAPVEQQEATSPLDWVLAVDKVSLQPGQSVQAILVLNNSTEYSLTSINIVLEGRAFEASNLSQAPSTVDPHSGVQLTYRLTSKEVGQQRIVFSISYSWVDPRTGLQQSRYELAQSEKIEVKDAWGFEWPGYLIPLILGFLIGQAGAWITDWRKWVVEEREKQRQAGGIVLAMLRAARKGIVEMEKVSFDLWEDAIVKGYLYPSLNRLGRIMKDPDLARKIAELPITLGDYNSRLENNTLTEDYVSELADDIVSLIQILEGNMN